MRKAIIVTFGSDGKSNPPSLLSNLLMCVMTAGVCAKNFITLGFWTFLQSGQSFSFASQLGSCRPIDIISNNRNIIEISRNGGFFVVNVLTSVCGQTLVKQAFRNILPSIANYLQFLIETSVSLSRNRSLILNSRSFYSAHNSEVEGTSLFTGACSVGNKHKKSPTDSEKYQYIVYFSQRTNDNNGAMGITGFCETRLCVCVCVCHSLDMNLRGSFWYAIRQCLISGTLLVIVLHSLGAVAELLHLQKSRFKVIAVAKNLQYDFGDPSKFGGPRLQPFSLIG